ncbi:MAG: site-2 protease family protein [Planctomycetota bacterium]
MGSDWSDKLEMLPWLLGMLIITSCVHEAGHAWAAWRCGDQRAYIKTRMSPLSFSHISLWFTIVIPALLVLFVGFIIGGARPVQVRTSIGPYRMALVALAGPMGNFLTAGFSLAIVTGLVHAGVLLPSLAFDTHYSYALFAVGFSIFLGFLNLIPIPPLDGSRVVAALLPEKVRNLYYSTLTIPGMILLLGGFLILSYVYKQEFSAATLRALNGLHRWQLVLRDWIAA